MNTRPFSQTLCCVDLPLCMFSNFRHRVSNLQVHGNWEERLQITNSSHTSHEIKTCIEIALRCVDSDPVKRPTIAEIVDELNKIDNGKGSLPDQVLSHFSHRLFIFTFNVTCLQIVSFLILCLME